MRGKPHWTRRGVLQLPAAIALAVIGLMGCNNSGDQKTTPEGGSTTPPVKTNADTNTSPDKSGKKVRVGLVLDTGGVDDKSFNAAAKAGLDRAKAELHLSDADARMVESRAPSVYTTNLSTFASQGFDVVFAVGFKMEGALKDVAAQFPNVKFAIVDGNAPNGAANCSSLQFKEEQGLF